MIVSVSQFTTFIYDFKNGDRPPSWILIFSHFCKKKSNQRVFLCRNAKFGEDRTIRGRVAAYF